LSFNSNTLCDDVDLETFRDVIRFVIERIKKKIPENNTLPVAGFSGGGSMSLSYAVAYSS
jgi:predicted esterase